jgi:sugar O-acyltransferase (sialic acid O-acetyltransferase NeuD family)
MRDLIILSTGVHAAEMAEIVDRVNRVEPTWNLLGYLTVSDDAPVEVVNGYPVLGTAKRVAEYPEASFVASNGWPVEVLPPRERLATLIDPSAFVSRTAGIGAGCVVYPHCYIGLNARIGDCVFMLSGCIVNHDDVVGNQVVMASGVTLAGNLHVEADCYLGQACTVRQFVRVGRNSLIGMGAVVVRDVPPDSVMAGNPARRLRDRTARG